MRAKNFVVNRGISCVNRGISCVNRGVSCFIRCILSCFIRCNPVFQSWSSRRERVKVELAIRVYSTERQKLYLHVSTIKCFLSLSLCTTVLNTILQPAALIIM